MDGALISGQQMLEKTEIVKARVACVLRDVPQARGDDRILILHYLRRYAPIRLEFEKFSDLRDTPSFETITRRGREVKRECKRYRPTPKTDDKRARREVAFRGYYGALAGDGEKWETEEWKE
jgi:hypothetical protein